MDCDISDAIQYIEENHGYLAVIIGDSSIQVFVTAERCELGTTSKDFSILVLFLAYYSNNEYTLYHLPWCPGFLFTVISRAIIIQFRAPSVTPASDDEEETYSELEVLISSGTYTSAYDSKYVTYSKIRVLSTVVGWAIKQGSS